MIDRRCAPVAESRDVHDFEATPEDTSDILPDWTKGVDSSSTSARSWVRTQLVPHRAGCALGCEFATDNHLSVFSDARRRCSRLPVVGVLGCPLSVFSDARRRCSRMPVVGVLGCPLSVFSDARRRCSRMPVVAVLGCPL